MNEGGVGQTYPSEQLAAQMPVGSGEPAAVGGSIQAIA